MSTEIKVGEVKPGTHVKCINDTGIESLAKLNGIYEVVEQGVNKEYLYFIGKDEISVCLALPKFFEPFGTSEKTR